MEKLGKAIKLLFTFVFVFAMIQSSTAQCVKFSDIPEGESAKAAYSTYRTYVSKLKTAEEYTKLGEENFGIVDENWRKAYDLAPAADGKRPTIWRDGIKLHKYKISIETDEAKKKEYFDLILKLYDEEQACYKTKGKPSYAVGRKAFDMYYGISEMRSGAGATLAAMAETVEKGGNDTEYVILDPYARVVVYQFTNDKMDKETARAIHTKLNEIADYNIANNESLKAYYEQAKGSMNLVFAPIEKSIFDCEYFIAKYEPLYPGNEGNEDFLIEAITAMKQTGCTKENSPFLVLLEADYANIIGDRNDSLQLEYERNNPAVMAKKLRDAGDYDGAIAKYEEAISKDAGDNVKTALYQYNIAQIKGKKQKKFSAGMSAARKAAELRPDWGEPIILMGDLYVSNAKKCGDAFKQKCAYIAAVDKYRQAKNIDPNVAEKANKKIGRYNSTRPAKDNAFMMGYKEGQTINLPCIGTSIKLRF